MSVTVDHGDCREIIPALGVTVDSVVCDPPYDLVAMTKRFGKGYADAKSPDHQRFARGFMNQTWDGEGVAFDPETWRIIGSVLRPGGFLLAFGSPRTHHRLASAIEDAGFVIQDCLMWLFATGFPKRRYMLKPAYEPIVLAYKPGGKRTLQVDECRVQASGRPLIGSHAPRPTDDGASSYDMGSGFHLGKTDLGRWPANICHDGSDEVVALFPQSAGSVGEFRHVASKGYESTVQVAGRNQDIVGVGYGDDGSAARFFFSSKAGSQDRWGSRHPTVKPVELMKWLVALVTPLTVDGRPGLVLDPFAGSGTTGVAALATGRDCILIEREAEYVKDIKERLSFYEGGGTHSVQAKNRNRKVDHGPLFGRPYDADADAAESYLDAIRACGERHKAGEPLGEFFRPLREGER